MPNPRSNESPPMDWKFENVVFHAAPPATMLCTPGGFWWWALAVVLMLGCFITSTASRRWIKAVACVWVPWLSNESKVLVWAGTFMIVVFMDGWLKNQPKTPQGEWD